MDKKTVLVTGGCGFIPSHFIEKIHREKDWNIIIIDKLNYASNGFERLRDTGLLNSNRIKIFTHDLIQPVSEGLLKEFGDVDYIVHMAAETHVDNSIANPVYVVSNNIMSTVNILEYARKCNRLKRFFYFSTDEVYGPAYGDLLYKETDRHNPTNPYSASKSAGEQICLAYCNTYNVPLITISAMNVFGARQHPEKFIPKCIKAILNGDKVYIHADKYCKVSGSRFYIHVKDISNAVLFLIENGVTGELYHVTSEKEVSNLYLAQFIASELNKPLNYELINFHDTRPGYDLRYALDGSKLNNLGWKCVENFEESLRELIQWTLQNKKWIYLT